MAELAAWILQYSIPLVAEVGPQTFRKYAQFGAPLFLAFLDYTNMPMRSQVIKALQGIAKDYVGKFTFAYSDG
jgi:hypothetical protein